ncbi:GA module-containing protein [Mycoplasmopsis verecunda]|uniref:GA module n=1 Tax=Mycoplasmopsis verecunda TaxID=171291 RepID=A0A1T4KGP7_9BACT|nr:GA module-containing protein [Mycoplasmopsis verecunda]WPB54236.1 GA module-containing protein [Mycoplasmopsis verecunda]SJZ41527.1 GA module [Mycoplasmopsis verecunda]
MKKVRRKWLLPLLATLPVAASASGMISWATAQEINLSNDLTQAKQQLKQYVDTLKFQYGIGGLRTIDIDGGKYPKADSPNYYKGFKQRIDEQTTIQGLNNLKTEIQKTYNNLVKYYQAMSSYATGDPLLGWGLNPGRGEWLGYNGSWLGGLRWPVREKIGFFYPWTSSPAWGGANNTDWWNKKFQELKTIVDGSPISPNDGNKFNKLSKKLLDMNTLMDTPDTSVDLNGYTHVGPVVQWYRIRGGMQGNIGGANWAVGVRDADDITPLVEFINKYKKILQVLQDNNVLQNRKNYYNTDFYKNLITRDEKQQFDILMSFVNKIIDQNQNVITLSVNGHELEQDGGKSANLLTDWNGRDRNYVDQNTERINNAQANGARNYQTSKQNIAAKLQEMKDSGLFTKNILDNLTEEANSKTNATDLNLFINNTSTYFNNYKSLKESFDSYSEKFDENQYKLSDLDKQEAYRAKMTQIREKYFKGEDDSLIAMNPSLTTDKLNQLKTEMKTEYDKLNGSQNKEKAIDKVNSFSTNISESAKDSLKDAINDTDKYSELKKVIDNQEAFNQNAGVLLNTYNSIQQKLVDSKLSLDDLITDPEEKQKVKEALKQAKELLAFPDNNSDNNVKATIVNSYDYDKVKAAAEKLHDIDVIIDKALQWDKTPEQEKAYENLLKAISEAHNTSELLTSDKIDNEAKKQLKALEENAKTKAFKKTPEQIQALADEINAKAAEAVVPAKNKAKEEIDKLNLPEELKKNLKKQIDDLSPLHYQYSANIIENGKNAESALKLANSLKDSLLKQKELDSYKYADDESQAGINDALKKVQDFIDNIDATKSRIDFTNIQKNALAKVAELRKNSAPIISALETAEENLPVNVELKNKYDAQKSKITTQAQAQALTQKLNNVKELYNSINNKDINHKLNALAQDGAIASDKQQEYQELLNEYNAVLVEPSEEQKAAGLDKVLATDDKVKVDQLIEKINNFISENTKALEQQKSLADAKQAAVEEAKNLNNLTPEQKNKLIENINNQDSIDKVNNYLTSGKSIDTAIANANKLLNDVANVPNETKYTQASNKQDFDTNKDALQKALETLKAQVEITPQNAETLSKPTVDNTTNLQDANKALNGDTLLADKKQAAKQAISENPNLTESQKTALNKLVDQQNTLNDVDSISSQANALASAREQLASDINEKTNSKQQPQYKNSTNKDALDNALTSATEALNANSELNDTQAISTMVEALQNAKEHLDTEAAKLNGQQNLEQAINEAKEEIAKNSNLSTDQINKFKDLIQNASTLDEVTNILDITSKLNVSIQELKDKITKAEETQKGNIFLYSSKSTQKALVDEIKNANDQLQQVQNAVINNVQEANALKTQNDSEVNKLQESIDKLDGKEKYDQQLNRMLHSIDDSEYLTPELKEQLKEQLKNATNSSESLKVFSNSVGLNTQAEALVKQVTLGEELQASDIYKYATKEHKDALDQAIANAQKVLKDDKLIPGISKEQTNALIRPITLSLDEAKKHINQLVDIYNKAANTINTLPNLTQQQKEALINELNTKTTEEDLNAVVSKAKELDEATKDFKDAIDSGNNLNKESNDYKLSDESKQQDFDSILQSSNQALEEGLADKSFDQINQLTNNLKSAQSKLNGGKKLEDQISKAKQDIDNLINLSPAQKDALKDLISNASDIDQVVDLSHGASDLNQALQKAQEAESKASEAKKQAKYLDAEESKQNNFNLADNNNSTTLLNAKANNDLTSLDKINNLVKELNNKSSVLNNDIEALDGELKLKDAKDKALKEIDGLNNLSDTYKQSLKDEINNQNRVQDVNNVLDKANKLNNLTQSLLDKLPSVQEAKRKTTIYAIDPEIKKQINNALDLADGLLNNSKLNNQVTLEQLQEVINNLSTSTESVNNQISAFEKARKEAEEQINKLPNLNNYQKLMATSELENDKTIAQINVIVSKAKELDQATKKINDAYTQANTIDKTTNDYLLADEQVKLKFDEKLQQVQASIKSDLANLDAKAIETLANELNNATEALNGNANDLQNHKQEAIDSIEKLSNLPQQIKDNFNELINQASDLEQIQDIVNKAANLDTALNNLNNTVTKSNELVKANDTKYQSNDKTATFNNSLQNAKDLLAQVANRSGKDNLNDLEQLSNSLQEKADELNNLNNDAETAKNNTLDQISKLPNLSRDEKDQLLSELAKAKNNEDVTNVLAKANKLNDVLPELNALTHLTNTQKQVIKDNLFKVQNDVINQIDVLMQDAKVKDTLTAKLNQLIIQANEIDKNSQDYKLSSLLQQSTFDKTLNNANDVLNKQYAGKSNDDLSQMIQELQNAMKLSGNETINELDDLINQLNLSSEQAKDQLHDQVTQLNTLSDAETLRNKILDLKDKTKELTNVYDRYTVYANTIDYKNKLKPEEYKELSDTVAQVESILNNTKDKVLVNNINNRKISQLAQALQNALDNANNSIKNEYPFYWWIALAVLSTIIFLVGITIAAKRARNKQNN